MSLKIILAVFISALPAPRAAQGRQRKYLFGNNIRRESACPLNSGKGIVDEGGGGGYAATKKSLRRRPEQ